jgi:Peptidase A4 family
MKIKPWIAGAVAVTAVTIGFGSGASAAVHHRVQQSPHTRALGILDASLAAPARQHPATKGINYNLSWAGYVDPADKNVTLRYVGADFNVPSLNCANSPAGTQGDASAFQGVGLDGYNDFSNETTGILEYCDNSTTATYQGWYALGPLSQTSTVTVSPGDAIQASIYYNASTKLYNVVLDDVTTGQAIWNVNKPCSAKPDCTNTSAEAVSSSGFGIPPQDTLADYGMENFTGGAVTSSSGVKGTFNSSKLWGSVELGLHDNSGVIMATPSSLQGGSAFSTTWRSAT